MNTIPHHVIRVIDGPNPRDITFDHNGEEVTVTVWNVLVEANSYGRIGEHSLTFNDREEAEKVEEGYVYDA